MNVSFNPCHMCALHFEAYLWTIMMKPCLPIPSYKLWCLLQLPNNLTVQAHGVQNSKYLVRACAAKGKTSDRFVCRLFCLTAPNEDFERNRNFTCYIYSHFHKSLNYLILLIVQYMLSSLFFGLGLARLANWQVWPGKKNWDRFW